MSVLKKFMTASAADLKYYIIQQLQQIFLAPCWSVVIHYLSVLHIKSP